MSETRQIGRMRYKNTAKSPRATHNKQMRPNGRRYERGEIKSRRRRLSERQISRWKSPMLLCSCMWSHRAIITQNSILAMRKSRLSISFDQLKNVASPPPSSLLASIVRCPIQVHPAPRYTLFFTLGRSQQSSSFEMCVCKLNNFLFFQFFGHDC